jgi:DNA-binding MarR family transcriptional regulator
LNGFRVAFASLLLVAVATSFLAGWGLVGSIQPSGNRSATTSTTTTYASMSSTSVTSVSTVTKTSTSTSSSPVATATATSTTTMTTTATGTVTSVTSVTTVTTGAAGETTTTESQGAHGGTPIFGAYLQGASLLREAQAVSILLAPVAWIVLGGAWVWRGRVRSRYTELGFGSDVFELFMKMKGGATRIRVLSTLSTPKDRLQLAEELGVDWKTVDRHVQILNRYGFVREQAAVGTVRLYEMTPIGRMLLNLFDDLERTDGARIHETNREKNF